jgi:23S rRNA pseudouridine2457 synthase
MLNKIRGMESQFVSDHPTLLLGEVDFNFPEGIHAIGRLDKDSEGLLLLTTNKKITSLLFQSKIPHKRTYLVQVKNKVSAENLQRLQNGVSIRIKGGGYYLTPPCDVRIVDNPGEIFSSCSPFHKYGTSTWLLVTLTEGKYHQVRKMASAINHRCQRLIRISIEDLPLNDLPPGGIQEFSEEAFFEKLKLDTSSTESRKTALCFDI